MTFIATTTATFMRGTDVDVYGDETDSSTPYATNVPVGITSRSSTFLAPDTGEPRIIQQFIGRVNPNFPIQKGDRLQDERSGQVYIIDTTTYSQGIAQIKSCRMELRVI